MNLRDQVSSGEAVLWNGKKSVKVSVLESIFNPMLPFALIWLIFDMVFIGLSALSGGGIEGSMALVMVPFFLLHLMPVWIYLGGVITSAMKAKNTEYLITDKGIYIQTGIISKRVEMKPFTDLSHVSLNLGVFDRICHTGDVVSECHGHAGMNIANIEEYEEVFRLVRELQENIYSDTMYPNDFRPAENHGYNTKYVRDLK